MEVSTEARWSTGIFPGMGHCHNPPLAKPCKDASLILSIIKSSLMMRRSVAVQVLFSLFISRILAMELLNFGRSISSGTPPSSSSSSCLLSHCHAKKRFLHKVSSCPRCTTSAALRQGRPAEQIKSAARKTGALVTCRRDTVRRLKSIHGSSHFFFVVVVMLQPRSKKKKYVYSPTR